MVLAPFVLEAHVELLLCSNTHVLFQSPVVCAYVSSPSLSIQLQGLRL